MKSLWLLSHMKVELIYPLPPSSQEYKLEVEQSPYPLFILLIESEFIVYLTF